jgi:CDP-diacylglycerol---glycerol-3-phosphate 3-phosphatidyltransferase
MLSRSFADVARGARSTSLPNSLSLLRIALVPTIVGLLLFPGVLPRALAATCFFVAALTDFFDGWLARRQGLTSSLGQYLDPLADKLIVAAVLIMLSATGPEPRVPAWMTAVMVLRELAVTGLRGIASDAGIQLPAQELGKYKTILQIFALQALLVHYAIPVPGTALVVDFHAGGMVFLWMALVVAVWSAIDYHVLVLRDGRWHTHVG